MQINKSVISGIHRAIVLDDQVYIPSMGTTLLNSGKLDTSKVHMTPATWCAPNRKSINYENGDSCWVMFDSGDVKHPVIMGMLGESIREAVAGDGSGSGGFGSGSGSFGSGKKVLICAAHTNTGDVGIVVGRTVSTPWGDVKQRGDSRTSECDSTRITAQAAYDYVQKNKPGLAELYPNINDYTKCIFTDIIVDNSIPKGFFTNYQAIIEIHYNTKGGVLAMLDRKLEGNSEYMTVKDAFKTEIGKVNGKGTSSDIWTDNGDYTDGYLVTQRCSIWDGQPNYFYLECSSPESAGKQYGRAIGEAIGKVICDTFELQNVGDGTPAAWALTMVPERVVYSMDYRNSYFTSGGELYFDCSSFVHWCYWKAGLLEGIEKTGNALTTEGFYNSSKFEKVVSGRDECDKFIKDGKLQQSDVLLRSKHSGSSAGSESHALIVASGSYDGHSFSYVNCGGANSNAWGKGSVKGTNDFFNSTNSYFYILRYKGGIPTNGSNSNSNSQSHNSGGSRGQSSTIPESYKMTDKHTCEHGVYIDTSLNTGITFDSLRLLQIPYIDLNGKRQVGEMVVHKDVANSTLDVFSQLYNSGVKIERMRLVSAYGYDDDKSCKANNTSAFNSRKVIDGTGSNKASNHAKGHSIDINPYVNPGFGARQQFSSRNPNSYTKKVDGYSPSDIKSMLAYSGGPLNNAFISNGWSWLANDYQHFDKY